MKKTAARILCFCLLLCLVLSGTPTASAYSFDLSDQIQNPKNRRYVQMMLDYYLRTNTAIRDNLEAGLSAVFLFEGCSDNMDDPELSDLSYYRVSAVCVVVELDENGEPVITYFNQDCSTLPDRPLEYGAWHLDGTAVGPATVLDGTYELYSVRHSGAYEALHVRTAYWNGSISAVYMAPEGFISHLATEINIHTRTGNHVIKNAMWSAGCILVGDGDWSEFTDLMDATYYSVYEDFRTDEKVGTLTINRQCLKEELVELYKNEAAVEQLLRSSAAQQPETYLEQCTYGEPLAENRRVKAIGEVKLMSLPCSNDTDARSIPVTTLSKGDKLEITREITNSQGNPWYEVAFLGGNCYVYAGDVKDAPKTFFERLGEFFSG